MGSIYVLSPMSKLSLIEKLITKDWKLSAAIIVTNYISSKAPVIGAISKDSFNIICYKKLANTASIKLKKNIELE